MKDKPTPKPILNARKKIDNTEQNHSIDALRDKFNNYKRFERIIKCGKTSESNPYSKKMLLLIGPISHVR